MARLLRHNFSISMTSFEVIERHFIRRLVGYDGGSQLGPPGLPGVTSLHRCHCSKRRVCM